MKLNSRLKSNLKFNVTTPLRILHHDILYTANVSEWTMEVTTCIVILTDDLLSLISYCHMAIYNLLVNKSVNIRDISNFLSLETCIVTLIFSVIGVRLRLVILLSSLIHSRLGSQVDSKFPSSQACDLKLVLE